jgi:hypothetical protein
MNPRVAHVTPLPSRHLHLLFSNGERGIFDCQPYLDFGVFQELRDWDAFVQVRVVNGTVVWPGGQDICPDTVYIESVRGEQEVPVT